MNFKKRKVAWVTGASSGIGKALSLKLSDEDWNLALTSRRVEELQKLKSDFWIYIYYGYNSFGLSTSFWYYT